LEAFPWDSAPRYLLRDRDGIYAEKFYDTAKWMGIREHAFAARKDAPVNRPVESPSLGHVMEISKVGGLHHLYTRKAA